MVWWKEVSKTATWARPAARPWRRGSPGLAGLCSGARAMIASMPSSTFHRSTQSLEPRAVDDAVSHGTILPRCARTDESPSDTSRTSPRAPSPLRDLASYFPSDRGAASSLRSRNGARPCRRGPRRAPWRACGLLFRRLDELELQRGATAVEDEDLHRISFNETASAPNSNGHSGVGGGPEAAAWYQGESPAAGFFRIRISCAGM